MSLYLSLSLGILLFCFQRQIQLIYFHFRLREELCRMNEQLKEYRQLIDEQYLLNRSYSFDDDDDDDSKPIEEIFFEIHPDYQSKNENQ